MTLPKKPTCMYVCYRQTLYPIPKTIALNVPQYCFPKIQFCFVSFKNIFFNNAAVVVQFCSLN